MDIIEMYRDLFRLYGGKKKRETIKLSILYFIVGVMAFISPIMQGWIVGNIQSKNMGWILILIILIDTAWSIGLNLLVKYFTGVVNNQVKNELRVKIFAKIHCDEMRRISKGELLTRVNIDISTILNIGNKMLSFLANLMMAVFSAFGILLVSPVLFVICFFAALLIIFINQKLNSRIGEYSAQRHEDQVKYHEMIDNMVSAYEELKFEDIKGIIYDRLDKLLHVTQKNGVKYDMRIDLPGRVLDFILGIAPIIGYICVFLFLKDDRQIVAAAVVAIGYIKGFLGKIIFVAFISSLSRPLTDSMERIKSIIDAKEQKPGRKQEHLNSIIVKELFYAYSEGRNVLNNISFEVRKGIVCLWGESGSGKSTLLKLLLGDIPVQKGKIRINNEDIENLDITYFRRKVCGYYPQEGTLFSGTIDENIRLYNPCYEEEYIRQIACKLNLIHEFGQDFLEKYIEEEGRNISYGQMARIRLLAVLSKKPELLILDEPTKSLDLKSAACIKNILHEMREKVIIIYATHDSSLAEISDEKIVLAR